MKPKSKIILFKGKKLKDGRFPIMLQLKIGKQYKRLSLGMSATEREWNATDQRYKNKKKYKTHNWDLLDYQEDANEILSDMYREMRQSRKEFSFYAFKQRFCKKEDETETAQEKMPTELLGFLDWYIDYLTQLEKLGDRLHYKALKNVLKEYGVPKDFQLSDVTKVWLIKFETFIRSRKNPHTGKPIKKVSCFTYPKKLRTLFSKARYFEVTNHYPFKNPSNPQGYSFSHLKSPRISKSISDEELAKFWAFDWENAPRNLAYAWKIAYFIYHFRGIPISDAARLTKDDISNNEVMFARIKTHDKVPNIPLGNEKRQWILKLFEADTDGYHLVPIFFQGRHDTPQQQFNRIQKIKTRVNSGMKAIAELQGIDANLHTYVLRHTFSRKVLNEFGIWQLKEVHGHKSVQTTQAYAGSLSNKEIAKVDVLFD